MQSRPSFSFLVKTSENCVKKRKLFELKLKFKRVTMYVVVLKPITRCILQKRVFSV